ncbi:uncharacterized protein B0I36DRAFT_223330, partial [Microdochium trichocladiopsis]
QPLLVHLNGDTTWLLQVPVPTQQQQQQQQQQLSSPSHGRSHFNILLDPWLQGPQSDVASWFSTQWHVVAPSVQTIAELQAILGQLETRGDDDTSDNNSSSYIDAVAISHEFTDHCHEATLRELPPATPVFATDKAADLIRSWKHFDTVVTTPGYSFASSSDDGDDNSSAKEDWHQVLSVAPLPPWLGIGRVVTPGNSLYYHSAVVVQHQNHPAEAVIYSPHGISPSDLAGLGAARNSRQISTLALLHGLHDVRIWMTKQLNLGAHNGLGAVRSSGARYWVATHDEVKTGGGFIAPLLRRVQWTVGDAVAAAVGRGHGDKGDGYLFVELGSGDGLVL